MWKALLVGCFRIFKLPRLVLIFYLANLVGSMLLLLPLRSLVRSFAGRSLQFQDLLSGQAGNFFFDFLYQNGPALRAWVGVLFAVLGSYVLLSLFLSAGAFGLILHPGRAENGDFLTAISRNLGKFFQLVLWAVPVGLLFGVLVGLVFFAQRELLGDDPLQSARFWTTILLLAFAGLLLVILMVLIDYGRVALASGVEKRSRRALLSAARFVMCHPFRTVGLFLILYGLGGLLLYGFHQFRFLAQERGTLAFLLVTQAVLAAKICLRLARYSASVELFRHFSEASTDSFSTPRGSETTLDRGLGGRTGLEEIAGSAPSRPAFDCQKPESEESLSTELSSSAGQPEPERSDS